MKRNAIARIIIYAIITIILSSILLVFLIADDLFISFGSSDGEIVNGQLSLPSDQIKNIEIDWAAGSIEILTANTDLITVSEQVSEESKYKMVYKIRGNTLSLEYASGTVSIGFGSVDLPEKNLVITVPENWVCGELEIDGASLSINIENLAVEEMDLDGASYNVAFLGSVDRIDIDGASADIRLTCINRVSTIDVDGASCELELILPQGCGFAVDVDGLSYGFHTELPVTTEGDRKVYGDKHCQISIDGISCEVTICEAEATMNAYSIVYANDFTEKMLIESPAKQYTPGTIVILKTDILMDADLELYVDGQFICNQTEAFRSDGTNYWEFYFTMPNRDVTVELRTSGGLLP